MYKLLLSLVFLLVGSTAFCQQPGKAELEKERAAIQKELDDVKQSLEETKRNKKASLAQLNAVQRKLQLREQQINVINRQMNLIEGDINQSWRDIAKLKKELDTLKAQYERSIVYSYKNRTNYDFLNFIFSAGNFNDALKRVSYLKSYRSYREEQASNIVHTQDLLQQKITVLNVNRSQKSLVLKEEDKAKEKLVEEKREKDEVVSKLKSREKELNKEFADKKRQDMKLGMAITAAIKRANDLAKAEAKKNATLAAKNNPVAIAPAIKNTGTEKKATKTIAPSVFDDNPAAKKLSDNFASNMGSLPWPIESGRISMHFGAQIIPPGNLKYFNNGLTFETEAGKPVKAVFDGEVAVITNIGSVEAVILRHGKYFTTYSNLTGVTVSKGQQIKTGQLLGKVAEKDDNVGELEFLICNDVDKYFDPQRWLRR